MESQYVKVMFESSHDRTMANQEILKKDAVRIKVIQVMYIYTYINIFSYIFFFNSSSIKLWEKINWDI